MSPQFTKVTSRPFWKIVGPLLLFLACVAAALAAQTLLYTIVAYLVSLTNRTGTDFGNTVNEIAGQYTMLSLAVGTGLVAITVAQADRALYRSRAFWNEPHKSPWQLDRIRKEELFRGFSTGALAALLFLVVFTFSGQLNYLGVYINSTLGTPIFPLFFTDIAALVVLLLCEEFLFRHKILASLLEVLPPLVAVALMTGLHLLLRHLQFQLEPMDYLSLALLDFTVGFFYVRSGKCQRGLGFLFSCLILLHNFAGLPLWDNECPSFFLFKAAPRSYGVLNGGHSGPLAGAGMAVILLAFALNSYLGRWRGLEARRQSYHRQPPL